MNQTPFSLVGHTALITGGGSGIGLAVAKCFAACGAKVILAGRREKELNEGVSAIGPLAAARVMDVTDTAVLPAIAESLKAQHGPISLLINNAGINRKKAFIETTDEDFFQSFQTNVVGALALTRALHPQLKQSGAGSVVFISSMAALFGIPWISSYSISKSALTGAVRTLSLEFGPDKIRVNAVAPGWIDTSMSRTSFEGDPERKKRILSRTPLGEMGETADIGWAVTYLCTPAAKFVTGTILPVDGGVSIGF